MPALPVGLAAGAVGHVSWTNTLHALNNDINSAGGVPALIAGVDLMPSGGDDTTAINNLLAAGTNVRLGEGVFIVSGPLNWPSPNTTTFQPSPSITGRGPMKTIVRRSGTGNLLNISAPSISGTGAFTSGTNHAVRVEGIKFEGLPGQVCIQLHRYFDICISDCWFTRVAGSLYGFDICIRDERTFFIGPPRIDDSNIGLKVERCLFEYFSVGVDTAIESAGAHHQFDFCYFQGVTPAQMVTILASYPGFLNYGLKLCANHITGIGTQVVSCVRGAWFALGGDATSIDRIPTAVALVNWHFEGCRDADLYVEACRGMDLYGCEFIDHNAVDTSWVPKTILVPSNGTNDVGSINLRGGFIAPSSDGTHGTNWRGVFCGSNFSASGKSYITIDSPFVTQMVGAGAMNDTTAANSTLVLERQGPIWIVNGASTRAFSMRLVADSTARTSVRSNGIAQGPGGVTAEDTLLGRIAHQQWAIQSLTATAQTSYLLSTPLSLVSGNFTSAAHAINTAGKFAGREAYDTTSGKPVWAAGGGTTAVWKYADGTTAYTPV